MPESFTKGQPIAQLQGKKLLCFGPQGDIQQIRTIAAIDQQFLAAYRQRCRRHLRRALNAD